MPIVIGTSADAQTQRRPSGELARDASEGESDSTQTGGERSEDARFRPGQTILGHYTVVKQLGKGGMGTVYLARDEVSGQEVAVKVLPASLARERDIRERFIQEARALASMDHHNIVPLITFAQEGEDRYLVMKYIQGEALDTRLRRLGVLAPEHARKVLRSMLAGLGYAHARGVIHRDVKPSNVLIEGDLDGDHRVFLVDFGIAKKEEGGKRLTQTGMLMGTPQYMSPEQIGGHPVDGRSDLYAAGLVLFEMLAGRPPFDGQKTFQVLRAHVEQAVPDVREVRGGAVPEDLVAITYLLLRKDPDERPADATAAIGLLDGTGSFPTLRPEEQRPPNPFNTPTAVVKKPHPISTSSPATGGVDIAHLDDPSREEIEAFRPRRAARVILAFLIVAAAATAFVLKPWERMDLAMFTMGADGGPASGAVDVDEDTTLALLLSKARVKLAAKDIENARVILGAVLEKSPDNPKALSLQVDVLVEGNALDDAEKAIARLKQVLAAHPEADDALRTHVDEQEKALAEKRVAAAKDADEAKEREREKEKERERPQVRAKPRPSELSSRAFSEITSPTKSAIGSCYVQHVQSRAPRASGEVVLTVRVQPAGEVDSVQIKNAPKAFRSDEFQRCLTREVKKWKFRAFPGDADSFVHKFYFSPGS